MDIDRSAINYRIRSYSVPCPLPSLLPAVVRARPGDCLAIARVISSSDERQWPESAMTAQSATHRRGECHDSCTRSDHPGHLDRRQGEHDRQARGLCRAGGLRRRTDHLLSRTLLRPLFRHHPRCQVLRLRRVGAGPDRGAVPDAGPATPDRHHCSCVRGGAARRALQHGSRHRCGRQLPRQIPQAPHPEPAAVLGEVLFPPGQRWLQRLRHRRRQGGRLYLL